MWIFNSKKGGKLSSAKEKIKVSTKQKNLITLAKRKIAPLKRKRISEESISDLSFFFKVFICKMYSIKQGLTLEKSIKRVSKKKISKNINSQIQIISKDILDLQYSGEKLEKKRMNEILKKIKELLGSY